MSNSNQRNIGGGGHDDEAINQLALVKTKLAALGKLNSELSTLCRTIQTLSSELEDMADSELENPTQHRFLGEETLHLVHQAKHLGTARGKYSDALKLVKSCVSLRCDDSRNTSVYQPHGLVVEPVDYGTVMSDCLRNNTHVTNLTLHLDTLFQQNHNYSLGMMQRKLKHLLYYIGHSTALRQVNVYCSSSDDDVVEVSTSEMTLASMLFDAIGQNQCIVEVHWCTYIPPLAFYNAMSTTTSVKKLIIECSNDIWLNNYSRSEKSMILTSFTQNQSVVHLELQSGKTDNDWAMTESILGALSRGAPNNNPPLQYLSMEGTCRVNQLRHLTRFLQSTRTLKHLEFREFHFLGGHMNSLVRGLELHSSAGAASSITTLSLTGSTFNDEAATAFVQYMQTPIPFSSSTADGNRQQQHVLQELHIDIRGDDEDVTEFAGVPLASAMVSLVTTRAAATTTTSNAVVVQPPHGANRQDTIGSQLRLLSLDPFNMMEGFSDAIQSAAGNIRLPSLCLCPFGVTECLDLPQWLPYVTSLEQLHITAVEDDVDPNHIIMALQQSPSLRSVTVTGLMEYFGRQSLTASHTRRIESICRRNQVLFKLLSRPTHVMWRNVVRGERHRTKRRKLRDGSDVYDETTLLLPSLIQAAKYMPHSRASTIMASLLVLEIEFS